MHLIDQCYYTSQLSNTAHCKVSAISPHDHRADWEFCLFLLPTANPGKEQNLKFKAWFLLSIYHFPTILKQKCWGSNNYKVRNSLYFTVNVKKPVISLFTVRQAVILATLNEIKLVW